MFVNSAEDISTTIKLCRKHAVPLTVAGGRHSTSGDSSIRDGLVIDLAQMRRVAVDPAAKTARVQGGCLWRDVDHATAEHGLATVAGTVNHTGVGGLTLGGGYGWLTGEHGLVVDNVLRVQIVLADGSVRYASAEENPDLFWAVRGAGQCFGVVAEFTFQLHEQRSTVYAGLMAFPGEKLEPVVEFANALVEKPGQKTGMMLVVGKFPPQWQTGIAVTAFHNGSEQEAESIFKPLLDLEPTMNSAKERPYTELNSMLNEGNDFGGRRGGKGAAYVTPIRPELVRSLLQDIDTLNSRVSGSRLSKFLLEFHKPDQWRKVSSKDMAYPNRGNKQNMAMALDWEGSANDQAVSSWASGVGKKMKEELSRAKAESPKASGEILIYSNYDGQFVSVERCFPDEASQFGI